MDSRHTDLARGFRLWRAIILHRAMLFLLGLGILLGTGAVLMGLWWLGLALIVGSRVLYDLLLACLLRGG